MNRTDNLRAELRRLASLPDAHGNLDVHLGELTAATARVLHARSCTFQWLQEEHSPVEGTAALSSASAGGAASGELSFKIEGSAQLPPDLAELGVGEPLGSGDPAGSMLCSPITANGRVIGVVQVSEPMGRGGFDGDDLRLLDIVTVYIGQSLHAAQLRGILHSRFAQIALAQSVDATVGEVLAAVPEPAQIVRLLARSFYREMTRAGFGTKEIINAASHIIDELNASLKRHARRSGTGLEAPPASSTAG